jgi:RND family efflux transporter MFP subunit
LLDHAADNDLRTPPAVLSFAFTAALVAACADAKTAAVNGAKDGKPRGPVIVRTVVASTEVIDRVVEITGTLGGAEEVTVSAEVDGRVDRIAADLGDAVARGGLLVQLQSTTQRLLAEQADADYLQALARLGVEDAGLNDADPARLATVKRADADLAEARRNTGRVRALHQKGVVTQNDLDTIETRERVAEATVQAAREEAAAAVATAKSKRAALGLAKKRLADTAVTSPIAGVVSDRMVSLGELVRAGQPVAVIVVGHPLKLKGDVPERYAGEVKPAMSVSVGLDAVGLDATGTISRVGPSVTSSSRTFRVEALVPNADGRLQPGLFARARVIIGSDETVMAVPETAVSALAGVTKVFVAQDGRAKERRVDVVRKRGSDALVTGDLQAGERVIVIEPATIAESLRVLVGGDVISSYREGDERYDIILRGRLQDRDSLEAIGRIPLRAASGAIVTLDNTATLLEAVGPTLILRLNGMRQVFLSANPALGTPLGMAKERMEEVIANANLPPGYDAQFLGDVKTLDEARRELALALLLSLAFVYMVLAAQFESFLHPVTILLALPLTAPFALLSLWVLGESINVYSIFGMFMLFGIVKKNGILQVDTTNQLLASGMGLTEAIVEANRVRLRPILMTTMTLIAAMAPMTIAQGPGAASRAALARVIVGGQALSLAITLLIVPVAYSLFAGARARAQRKGE